MTTLEAVTPVIYRWPGGEVRLQPGERVNLPEDRARRLMQKAGSRVREVIKPGTSVRFTSPVFGPCTARVLVHDGETVLVADHEVMGAGPICIKAAWITAHEDGSGSTNDTRPIPGH